MRRLIATTATVLAALALAGCASSAPQPKAAEPPAQATTTTTSAPAVKLDALRDRSKLPTGFPFEAPVVGGTITSSGTRGQGADLGPFHVIVRVDAPEADVVAWYKSAFAQRNWVISLDTPQQHFYGFEKGAGAWSTLTFSTVNGKTQVEQWLGIGVPVPKEAGPPDDQVI